MSNLDVWTKTVALRSGVSILIDSPALSAHTDESLVRLVRDGEVRAFEQLYSRHHRRTYRLAYSMTGRHETAEELTQEVFLRVYRKLDSFRGEASFATWLHRLTINHCLNYCRATDAKAEEQTDEQSIYAERHNQEHIELRVLQTEVADQVHSALQSLPVHLRVVVILRDIEEMSYEEIADRLACSPGTVGSRLSRARALLARKLENLRGKI